ncbi:MAG: hypothetical protein ACI4JB_10935 [Porcipelethomonas sp.]
MERDAIKKELKFIFFRSVFLDIAAYLISVIFIGFTLPVAAGLLIGTFGMLLNLFLLNRSVYEVVRRGGNSARKKMLLWYFARMLAVSAITVTAMLWSIPCMIAALLPYFYPKLVYGGKTLFGKEEKTE